MGGRSKSRSTQQSRSGLDPALRAAQLSNIERATGVAQNLQARQFAAPSAGMGQAQEVFSRLTNYSPEQIQAERVRLARNIGLPDAMSAARGVSQFTPQQIAAQQAALGENVGMQEAMGIASAVGQYSPQQVQAGSFLNKNLQAYMNPYQQAVIDTTLSDIERSRQLGAQADAAQAVRARAFGGSRQAVLQSETNRAALEQAARSAAQLRAQGYEAATGLMGQELTMEQQAALANQRAGLEGAQQRLAASQQIFGMGESQQRLGLQADLANQQAALEAARANQQAEIAGAQQRLAGAQQLYGMGEGQQRLGLQASQLNQAAAMEAARANQAAGLTAAQQQAAAAQQLYGIGADERAIEQARLDAARNLELERQQIINQALGLNVGGGSGITSQSTGSSSASSFNITGGR